MTAERVEVRKEELTGREVLAEVYQELLQRHSYTKIQFEKPIYCEIADDGDSQSWGSDRVGYTMFEEASIIDIRDQKWVVAVAKQTKGYAASDMAGELKAFKINSQENVSSESVAKQIAQRSYYRDTVFAATAYGNLLTIDHSRVSVSASEKVRGEIDDLVARKTQMDNTKLNLGILPPPVKSPITYHSESVEVLLTGITDTLSSS